jgi:hypothetical protein
MKTITVKMPVKRLAIFSIKAQQQLIQMIPSIPTHTSIFPTIQQKTIKIRT